MNRFSIIVLFCALVCSVHIKAQTVDPRILEERERITEDRTVENLVPVFPDDELAAEYQKLQDLERAFEFSSWAALGATLSLFVGLGINEKTTANYTRSDRIVVIGSLSLLAAAGTGYVWSRLRLKRFRKNHCIEIVPQTDGIAFKVAL